MSRVKLSEYKAKQLLVGEEYKGIQLHSGEKVPTKIEGGVFKVDQGVKKRMKQGLVALNVGKKEIAQRMAEWKKKGFSQFLLEPMLPHETSEEQYLSLERVREGVRVLHSGEGGVDIEAQPEKVKTYVIKEEGDVSRIEKEANLPEGFLKKLYTSFEEQFFAFLEINPLVVQSGVAYLLDAAVLVDSAGEFFVKGAWSEDDIVQATKKHEGEVRVEELAATTPASLKLNVINPDGSLFFLLSGGGGSIVIADEAQLQGVGSRIGNYGEYSGGPTREETYLYAKEVIRLTLGSKQKHKALIIAGGVANFTDVKKTFLGIIDALKESAAALRKQKVRVFVRRGGPNEVEGLALMERFLREEDLFGSVYGSDEVITKAVQDAIAYIQL